MTTISTISAGDTVVVSTDVTATQYVLDGGFLDVVDGGVVSGTILTSGVESVSSSGGTDISGSVSGNLQVNSGGFALDPEVHDGGFVQAGVTGFGAGGVVSGAKIDSNGPEFVNSGGTDIGATINADGTLAVNSGGTAISATIHGGGSLQVNPGGTSISAIDVGFISFTPPVSGSYISEIVPFYTDGGATLDLLLLWNVGLGSADAPFQILQYDTSNGSFFDDTSNLFSGSVPDLGNPRNVTFANFNGNGLGFIIAEQGLDQSPWPGTTDTLLLWNSSGQLFDASANLPQTLAYTHDLSSGVINKSGSIGVYFNNIYSQPNGAPYYLIDNGNGTFVNESSGFLPSGLHSTYPAYTASDLVDVNGDGLADLIIGPEDQTKGSGYIYLNPGNGNFSAVTPIALPGSPLPASHGLYSSTLTGPTVLDIQPIYLNGADSPPDLVVLSTNGNYEAYAIQILVNNGGGHFTDETASLLSGAPSSVIYPANDAELNWMVRSFIVDLNGNGPDIVTQGNGGGPSLVFLNNGSGDFSLTYSVTNNPILAVATIAGVPTLIENNGDLVPYAAPPIVAAPIAEQDWTVGQSVSFTMPAGTFTDPGGQDLTYSASGSNGAALPAWLSFDSATATFSGMAAAGPAFTLTITATDPSGWLAEDSFVVQPLTVVGGGATLVVSSKQTSDGLEPVSGGIVQVKSGGTTSGAVVASGDTQIISAHGTDEAAQVSGGTQLVYGYASGATNIAGVQVLESGGTTSGSVVSGGTEIVSAHGVDRGAIVPGGTQLVYGYASGATVSAGVETILAGGTASATIVSNGGTLNVSSGGLAARIALSGGTEEIGAYVTEKGTKIGNGGTQSVGSGGSTVSATVFGGGLEAVASGGVASTTVLSGGGEVVLGGAISATVLSGGALSVGPGGVASATHVSSGGTEYVLASGLDRGATLVSGTEVVSLGGTATGTILSKGGNEYVFGSAVAIGVVSGGKLFVEAGGVASTTRASAGGTDTVLSAGLDESAVLAGGTQIVSSGGTASGTVISTGTEIISALGIDSAARLIGGTQLDYGLASGDIVSAGSQVVEAGGTASNTTVSKGILVVSSGGLLSLSGGGIATGATVSAASGGTAAISGLVVDSGYLILSGVTSVAAGATLPTASGGTALLNGAVSNSGTLFASGAYSLVEVLSGATVTGGGSAEVGNGIVEIQNADDDQNVVFLSGGTGGVELDDTLSNPTAYSGTIVGFGSNTHQLIDLVSVKSNSTVKLAYTSASVSSGTLTVSSGGSLVASIALSGGYTSASFHLGAGTGGTVEIIDPPVEVHSANLGLFGQYIAGGFVIAPGSVAGAAVADAWGTGSQELPLAHPHG